MTQWVSEDLDLCIGCNRCMDACPVSKDRFTIGDLNLATMHDSPVPSSIREFAFNCMQCSRCVPVCPAGARRDYMVLHIKHKLRKEKPPQYTRYLKMKGPFVTASGKVQQKLFAAAQRIIHRDLAPHMETDPATSRPLLFYPGCYIYNTHLTRRQLRLLDHVGEPYNVLGGLNTCCGIPQILQGEFDLADRCLDSLHERIMRTKPRTVITACAECFEALLRIRGKFGEDFEVLTVLEYLMQHLDRFSDIRLREKVTFHDSCRISRRYHRGGAARDALDRFSDLAEMENCGDTSTCCYYWNLGNDPANEQHRRERLREAKGYAGSMVCECVSCYEKYHGLGADEGIDVIDILEFFEAAMDLEPAVEETNDDHRGNEGPHGDHGKETDDETESARTGGSGGGVE